MVFSETLAIFGSSNANLLLAVINDYRSNLPASCAQKVRRQAV